MKCAVFGFRSLKAIHLKRNTNPELPPQKHHAVYDFPHRPS